MKIADTLASLRKNCELTQAQVSQFLESHGVSASVKVISKWECGGSLPDAQCFVLLCDLYGVSDVVGLFTEQQGQSVLNDLGRKRLVEYMRLLQSNDKYLQAPARRIVRQIALYDLPVSAGTGLFLDSDHYEMIDVDDTVPSCATFAVRISGDSMTPRFTDQQIVFVRQTPTLEKGKCGIFILNGDAYCKLLGGDTDTELISLNKKYNPIRIQPSDELRVVGEVVS